MFDYLKVKSNSPKKFRFVLDGQLGFEELTYSPIENKEGQLEFARDMFYLGVFNEYIVKEFTFIKDGKDYLKSVYEASETFGNASLRVYYFDYTTRTYKEMPTSFKVDFNTYRHVKYRRALNAVKVNLLPVNEYAKLLKRENTEVDITKSVSLGGFQVDTNRDHWTSLKDVFNFPEIKAYYQAVWSQAISQNYASVAIGSVYVYIPELLISSDFAEAQTVTLITDSGLNKNYGVFINSASNRTLTVTGEIVIKINEILKGGSSVVINLDTVNGSNVQQTTVTLATYNHLTTPGTYTITINETVTVNSGEYLLLYALSTVVAAGSVDYDIVSTDLFIKEGETETPATTIEAYPWYEALERTAQLIFDKQFPIYSEFFGRTDVVWNTSGDLYLSENQERFANIMSGLAIRGLPIDQDNCPIHTTFKDMFQTAKALWNVAAGFETISGDTRLRIEELSHFFANSEALDLSARLYDIEIEQEANPGLIYAKIQTGYNKYDYFLINGRGEYNTVNKRTTEAPNDSIFVNISPIRGDTRGATLLLAKPIATTGTEDVRGDEDTFIFKSQRNGNEWDAETDENIQVLNNSSLFQEGSLNLFFTPVRNMLRHSAELRAGHDKNLLGYLKFQAGSKLTNLETTDGVDNVVENEDIAIADLGDPLWYAENLNVRISFFEADYEAIKANPKGYIKLGDDWTGWIEKLTWDMTKNMANIKLIRRWV